MVFAVMALFIIQCRRRAKNLSNLTTQNLLSIAGNKGMWAYLMWQRKYYYKLVQTDIHI
jgi:hypothetical protein